MIERLGGGFLDLGLDLQIEFDSVVDVSEVSARALALGLGLDMHLGAGEWVPAQETRWVEVSS